MINLPLRRIQSLVCLAEAGTFHGAAARLGLSQPAVSAHIRTLEEQFGVPLVHRTTRHVSLTPEGEAFVARAQRAFAELQRAAQGLHDLSAAQRGEVTVACIPPFVAFTMPRVMRALQAAHPLVEVQLRDVMSSQLEPMVARQEAEIAIGPLRSGSALAFETLLREDFVAIVPHGHALAGQREVKLAELITHPLVANAQDTNARATIEHALRLRRGHASVRPRFALLHYVSIIRFVEAGLGVSVLPRTALAALGNTNLVTLELRGPRVWREIGLLSRREYRPSPAAAAFIAVLRRVVSQPG